MKKKVQLTYPSWVNISESLQNNMFHYGADKRSIRIPDGYWDVCTLKKEVFTPLGIRLTINPATGRVSFTNLCHYFDLGNVGSTLGFSNLASAVVEGPVTADLFPKLIKHNELYINLAGLSTSENRHNALLATLLRAIPVGQEECNGGRQVSFKIPHFKRLKTGTHSDVEILVKGADHEEIKRAYLSLVFEIRRINVRDSTI